MKKKINWIISYPKSGNTWLRAIMSSFLFTTDGVFNLGLLKLIEQFEKKKWFNFTLNIDEISNKKLSDIKLISKYWLEAQEKIIIEDNYNFFHNFFKTHSLFANLDGNEFTNEKITNGIIYIIRDPRDIAVSFSKHMGQDINSTIDFMINKSAMFPADEERVPTLLSRWDYHYISWQKINVPKILIKYEDLISDTKRNLKKIHNFIKHDLKIEIESNEIIIENIYNTTHFNKLQEYEKQKGFSEATKNSVFFREGKSMQWKNILDAKQIKKIEKEFSSIMKKLDYL